MEEEQNWPILAPRRATSNRQSITCFSFLRMMRSSVSKSRHSKTPRPLRHQDMKLETLSRAKNVPALAPGKDLTQDNLRTEAAMAAPDLLYFCRRETYSSAYFLTLLACCNKQKILLVITYVKWMFKSTNLYKYDKIII